MAKNKKFVIILSEQNIQVVKDVFGWSLHEVASVLYKHPEMSKLGLFK